MARGHRPHRGGASSDWPSVLADPSRAPPPPIQQDKALVLVPAGSGTAMVTVLPIAIVIGQAAAISQESETGARRV